MKDADHHNINVGCCVDIVQSLVQPAHHINTGCDVCPGWHCGLCCVRTMHCNDLVASQLQQLDMLHQTLHSSSLQAWFSSESSLVVIEACFYQRMFELECLPRCGGAAYMRRSVADMVLELPADIFGMIAGKGRQQRLLPSSLPTTPGDNRSRARAVWSHTVTPSSAWQMIVASQHRALLSPCPSGLVKA